MAGSKRVLLLFVGILSVWMLSGQNAVLNKKVNLPAGKVMLKTALHAISSQTGCVFSYDPTKVIDKQIINISNNGALSLRSALSEVLPKDIRFTQNGKYIVLQEVDHNPVVKSETTTNKAPKLPKSFPANTKGKGTINKDPALERLVLPPLINNTEIIATVRTVDQLPNRETDSIVSVQDTVTAEKKETSIPVPIVEDTVSIKQTVADGILKTDTDKIRKPGFGPFIRKNGYLESGISINNQLAALFIHAGLYNVYGIVSIGSDYNDSYLLGIGAGACIKINAHFSLNFDFLQNSVIAGKSYLLQVKASNTQIIPVLNFSYDSFKVFAGPTLNLIKSSYVSSISTTDLGLLVGIGYSAGIKIDLMKLLSKQN